MVTREGELGALLLDDEVIQLTSLLWELIAQADALVIYTEAEVHHTPRLLLDETHQQLLIVIADGLILAPDRRPGLVKGRGLLPRLREALEEALRIVELVAEATGLDDGLTSEGDRIVGLGVTEGEGQLHLTVGGCHLGGLDSTSEPQTYEAHKHKESSHICLAI